MQDKEKIELIDRLKAEGKIKNTGRSPVKLHIFENNAQDHLYVNTVTKRVPVASDNQIRFGGGNADQNNAGQRSMSPSIKSPTTFMGSSRKFGINKNSAQESEIMSPHTAARYELQSKKHESFTIKNKRSIHGKS